MRIQIKKSGNSNLIRISNKDLEAYDLKINTFYDLEFAPIPKKLPVSKNLIKDIKEVR